MTTTTTIRPASPKQIDFIHRLFAERGENAAALRESTDLSRLSIQSASRLIDSLMEIPRPAPVHTDGDAIGLGYYLAGSTVYKVVESKTTHRPYAKLLNITEHGRANWEYAPGGMRLLTSAVRLTVEEAARLGHLHGVCMVCGRTLTDPASVTRGIGPVCASRL